MTKQTWLACAAALALSDAAARAVIITGTGDGGLGGVGRNSNLPTGDLSASGWVKQGCYGSFLGTPVSNRYFLTAAHFGGGNAGEYISLADGKHYLTGVNTYIPGTDLVLHQVSADTPFIDATIAPLYDPDVDGAISTTDRLVIFGRGTARGAAVSGKGWEWSADDHVVSWGTNTADEVRGLSTDEAAAWGFAAGTQFVFADFDLNGDPNEGTLSSGDSGGGVFVKRGGIWKLAAINYGVEVFNTGPSAASAAVAAYNAIGLYENGALVAGTSPRPQNWVSSFVGQGSTLAMIQSSITLVPEPTVGLAAVAAAGLLRRRR